MTPYRAVAFLVLPCCFAAACVAHRRPGIREPCAARRAAPEALLCQPDAEIRSLRARFRVSVEAGGDRQTAEGVLLVQRPGALRLKLFGPGGMTVHDALWASREASVKGLVQRPLEGPPLVLDVSPEQSVGDPVAELSFVLWGLWQARCATPPRPGPRDPLRFELDPRSAHASQRAMRIDPGGIDQETIVRRMSAPPSEERLVVRYADHDCTLPVALPRRIEMVSETRGWRAEVVIFEQSINERLDPRLFRIPADSAASQGDPQ